MSFKEGDKLICIKEHTPYLTAGKLYLCTRSEFRLYDNGNFFTAVTSDLGERLEVYVTRFRSAKDHPRPTIKETVVSNGQLI